MQLKHSRMESRGLAPVDSMGAGSLSMTGTTLKVRYRRRVSDFTLMATMLSPQTKDQQTNDAFHNLLALVLNKGGEFRASSLAESLSRLLKSVLDQFFL